MNKLLNAILRASISASLSDREAFTDRVASIIEDKTGRDPDAASRMSDNLASAMESINENLLIDQLLKSSGDGDYAELEKKIDRLTDAIDRLNENLSKR